VGDKIASLGFYSNDTSGGSGGANTLPRGAIDVITGNTFGSVHDMVFRTRGDVATDASEKLRITSVGRVGIGTTSPDTTLHISSTDPRIKLTDTSLSGNCNHEIRGADQFLELSADSGNSQAGSVMKFKVDNAEAMRIDSSGRLGIGTTSPAANLHVSSSGDTIARITSADGNGAFLDLGDASDPDGGRIVYDSGSNLALYTASTERLRIDSSGNVGIGTTSPSQLLHVNGTARATTVLSGDGTASAPSYSFSSDTDTGMFKPFPDTLAFSEGGVERMRINSSGNVGIGVTTMYAKLHVGGSFLSTGPVSCGSGGTISSAGYQNTPAFIIKSWTSTSTTYYPMLRFATSGSTEVGTIKSNNTSTQYNTSSDVRLKENIRNAEDAGAKIDAIQIRQFDWKNGGEHQDYGVIAQELKEVAPEAVSEGNDEEEMWGVDYSKLVPTLIKEIQSLRNRVAELEKK
jgi:hypothetical protein